MSTHAVYEEELIAAACAGKLDKVMSYIAQDVDANAKKDNGWSALMSAAEKGHLEIVKYLKEHGETH